MARLGAWRLAVYVGWVTAATGLVLGSGGVGASIGGLLYLTASDWLKTPDQILDYYCRRVPRRELVGIAIGFAVLIGAGVGARYLFGWHPSTEWSGASRLVVCGVLWVAAIALGIRQWMKANASDLEGRECSDGSGQNARSIP